MARAVGLGFGPGLTFAAALIAAGIAFTAYRQRKEADERAEWWRRTQWALEHASDADSRKVRIGLRMLNHLTGSSLARDDDKAMIQDVLDEVIDVAVTRDYDESTEDVSNRPTRHRLFCRLRRD